jgi:hypothetical protein
LFYIWTKQNKKKDVKMTAFHLWNGFSNLQKLLLWDTVCGALWLILTTSLITNELLISWDAFSSFFPNQKKKEKKRANSKCLNTHVIVIFNEVLWRKTFCSSEDSLLDGRLLTYAMSIEVTPPNISLRSLNFGLN